MMTGIERIDEHFKQGQSFIGYLTAGDGGIKRTLDAAMALIEGGITLLELGVPFSDPVADGPVIQRASTRALLAGTTIADVLWLSSEIRKKSAIPLVLFSYFNPILAVDQRSFFHSALSSGIDGVLIVDCPFEESTSFYHACTQQGIAPIYVVTPTTPVARLHKINQHGHGFLYYACRNGTTGIKLTMPEDFAIRIHEIQAAVDLPVVAGFGIASYAAAEKGLQSAAGVVVGSLFVKALEDGISMADLTNLALSINPLRTKS